MASSSSSILSFSLPKLNLTRASSAPSNAPVSTSLPETLDHKFGRKGIKFSESSNGVPLVELTVRNGSSLKLQIPNAHVISYKPKVYWKDDGFEEVLYTLPSDPTDPSSSTLHACKGGIGLVINDSSPSPSPSSASGRYPSSNSNPTSSVISNSNWTVKDVDSDSIDAVQVELSCSNGSLDITYVVSLYPLSMATAVIVKNNGGKAVNLTTAILTHFKSKKRNGTAVQGLRSCTYCTYPPPSSKHELLSPSEALKSEDPGWFSFGWEPEKKIGDWTIQDVPFTILRHKISRVYSAPPSERAKDFYNTIPSNYEILDQGRELFFRVIKIGFEDIYLASPGSLSQRYGKKEYFICTGPASLLVPIVVNPGEEWRGAQVIEHDNL